MNRPDRFESVVAEAPPAADTSVVTSKRAAAQLEMLDGDEVVQLSIKPSLWFIPLRSARVVVALAIIAAALSLAMQFGTTPTTFIPFHILTFLAALRVGVAALQWASRLYVLTNRRVMRFRGVYQVDVAACLLRDIHDVQVVATSLERPLRLGNLRMTPKDNKPQPPVWESVARPAEVQEILFRAIRKAQS